MADKNAAAMEADPRFVRLKDHGWKALRVLGKGQFGIAYQVTPGQGHESKVQDLKLRKDPQNNYFCVAKMVALDFLSENDAEQAMQEVTLLKSLNHSNIVAYYDHYLAEEPCRELVILMEFCEGGELRGRIKDGSKTNPPKYLPEDLIMRWFCQSLSALTYVHKMYILHRDLKSSNIFLKNNDRDVSIGDFGISRVLEGTVCAAATVVGTPYYMSPENLLGLVYKIVSDRYDPIPGQYSQDLNSLISRLLDKSAHSRPTGTDIMAHPYVRKHMSVMDEKDSGGKINYRRNQMSSDVLTGDTGPQRGAGPPGARGQDAYKKRVAPTLGPSANRKKPGQIDTGGPQPPPGAGPRMPSQTPMAMDNRNLGAGAGGPGGAGAAGQPQRRQWTAAGGNQQQGGATGSTDSGIDENVLLINLMMSRVRHAIVGQKLNWMHVFAMFDRKSEGSLNEADFSRAMTAMHLGLSHQEIKDIFNHLKGPGSATTSVQVNAFAKAINSIPTVVTSIEDWGIQKLVDVSKQTKGDANMVTKNSKVRIVGLRNSPQLNGQEGVATNWDPTACRWIIQLNNGDLKAIKDANLQLLEGSSGGNQKSGLGSSSASLYHKICGSDPSGVVAERAYLEVISDVVSADKEKRRMVALAPKNVEGYVDVRALLANEKFVQLGGISDDANNPPATARGTTQSTTTGGGGPSTTTNASRTPGGNNLGTPINQNNSERQQPGPPPTPGAATMNGQNAANNLGRASQFQDPPQSPTKGRPPPPGVPPTPSSGMGKTFNVTLGGQVNDSTHESTVISLWRLGMRLQNTGANLKSILSLFCKQAAAEGSQNLNTKVLLDELLEAVSTCPLGISRVEAQRFFMSLAGATDITKGVMLDKLEKSIHSALERYGNSPPNVPDEFDRINFSKLELEAGRLDAMESGFLAPQTYRMMLMQCEPYLSSSELDWIISVTDKDGDGNLEYSSFVWRKNPQQKYVHRWAPPSSIVTQVQFAQNVAPNCPPDYVQKVLLARLRTVCDDKGTSLSSILPIFPDGLEYLRNAKQHINLKVLLAYLPFGLSKDEAAFLVNNAGGVAISNFLNGPTGGSTSMVELSGWAKSKLGGPKMNALKSALADQYQYTNDDWFMVDELLQCLHTAVPDMNNLDDDRCLLLVEKNFSGKLNAVDFWYKVSGEKSFLTGGGMGKTKTMGRVSVKTEASMRAKSMKGDDDSEGGGGGGGLCGCLKKKK